MKIVFTVNMPDSYTCCVTRILTESPIITFGDSWASGALLNPETACAKVFPDSGVGTFAESSAAINSQGHTMKKTRAATKKHPSKESEDEKEHIT